MARSGAALQIVSANGWMLRDPEDPGPVLVLICENCGGGSQHPAADLGQAFGRLCREAGFDLQRPHLELIGTCESCRTTAETEQDGGRIYATL
ncbi:hypothetical protein L6Q21_13765 [Sandaracinobacter sp. RS1-74]|nr:hypothetical protein [Sandaracinobacteroides sayramensis]